MPRPPTQLPVQGPGLQVHGCKHVHTLLACQAKVHHGILGIGPIYAGMPAGAGARRMTRLKLTRLGTIWLQRQGRPAGLSGPAGPCM